MRAGIDAHNWVIIGDNFQDYWCRGLSNQNPIHE